LRLGFGIQEVFLFDIYKWGRDLNCKQNKAKIMTRKLLLPIDNSDKSVRALEWTLKNVIQTEDYVILLHCYDTNPLSNMNIFGKEGN
jgi:hypothetical protein